MPVAKVKKFSRSKTDAPGESYESSLFVKKSEKKQEKKQETKQLDSDFDNDTPEDATDYSTQVNYAPREDDNFLAELNNENYKEEAKSAPPPPQPATKKEYTDSELLVLQLSGGKPKKTKQAKTKKQQNIADDDSLFDDVGTVCLGREKREMIAKINQYKSLFPDELKQFKIKKNASTDELKTYLDEMECIVDCSSVEQFMNDSILQCIRMVEGVSTYSNKYNIQGCADMLKGNKQFHSLCKQLYIKYKVFSQLPPEYSLIMVVATTMYIAKQKNSHRAQYESFLNQPINPPQ